MKEFKSFAHVSKLLGLGLKKPESEATVPTSAIVGAINLSGSTEGRAIVHSGNLNTSREIAKHVEQSSENQASSAQNFSSKFESTPGAIDPLQPFKGIECDDQFQTYVTRKDREIPVLVEIASFRNPDGIDRRWAGEQMDDGEVIFGSCFDLHGVFIDLSPEELERIEREFRA